MEFEKDLLDISPIYRKLIDRLHQLERENGVLRAAYGNAVNDQQRAKDDLKRAESVFRSLAETIANNVVDIQISHRDDPGRNGSGR